MYDYEDFGGGARGGSSAPSGVTTSPAAGGWEAPREPQRGPFVGETTVEKARRLVLADLLVLERAVKALDARDPEAVARALNEYSGSLKGRHQIGIALVHALELLEGPHAR